MYEFAAAYALARELGQELVLDVAACTCSSWGYSLDYFRIPDVKKLTYRTRDALHTGHMEVEGIPDVIRENCALWLQWLQEENDNCSQYKSLDTADPLMGENIILCGYFCDRKRYFQKYWDEIRAIFTLRKEEPAISCFKEVIKNRISVGVHIRRGDFLVADFTEEMQDEYYRAAIVCCREKFGSCIFAIFSDDIEYAKAILGMDSSLYYVHFPGYDNAAMLEFVCLSLCDHRIMTNCSTFSGLADQLNGNEERKTFWQDSNQNTRKLDKSSIDFQQMNIRLNEYDIRKYGARYQSDGRTNIDDYKGMLERILDTKINQENAAQTMKEIVFSSLNIYERPANIEKEILYQLFLCHVETEAYHDALEEAFMIYDSFAEDRRFSEALINALWATEAYEEAILELVRLGKHEKFFNQKGVDSFYYRSLAKKLQSEERRHFLLVPYTKMQASSRIAGLTELGLVLRHLGHCVSFVFEPEDESEETYIRKNPVLKNRREISLGCRQYLWEDVMEEGVPSFLKSFGEEKITVISRRKEFFGGKEELAGLQDIHYVFLDFSDDRDAETRAALRELSKRELTDLYTGADMILTKKNDLVVDGKKIVQWNDNESHMPYEIKEERWHWQDNHSLSKLAIGMAAGLLSNL